MRVTVVALGPGPLDYVTPAARALLRADNTRVLLRTRYLPQIELLDGTAWESCDDLYESATSLAEVEAGILARILASPSSDASLVSSPSVASPPSDASSSDRDVVLAVPGDGALGESIVVALRAAGVDVEIIPGVGFGPAALAATGMAAANGAQLVEATALGGSGIDLLIELNPRWPAVVSGVFSPSVAGDLKLALQRVYPAEHRVMLVRHAGLADQAVREVPLSDLDRSTLELDHLTCVVIPAVEGFVPNGSAHGLRAIIARLRAPEIGCPWDLQQTHRSLIPYVIEEAYEVVDAIEQDDPVSLADELGDVMLQIALHAEVADQAGEFDWNDVMRNISEKMVRRHPHVFGEVEVSGAADVVRNWAQLKAAERADEPAPVSAVDGVAKSLPQLKRAAEISRKATKAGFDWPDRQGTLDKVREELAELLAANTLAERREELGDLLYILAKLAQQEGVDPEEALRYANEKFVRRFHALEKIATERGWPAFSDRPLSDLNEAWQEAKRRTAQAP
jgi:tetrapyrrole methylase family protein/MazG family protein